MITLDKHTFPPGGWQFLQPQTGWRAPTPVNSTYAQTVDLIIKHRLANPAIVAKHKLAIMPEQVGQELMSFNATRLGVKEAVSLPKQMPRQAQSGFAGGVGAAAGSLVDNIKRAALGTGVVVDWLMSGGKAVEQSAANLRAEICSNCPLNQPGSWYTTAPAKLIKETLEARSDLKLETPFDEKLQSCQVCRCLNRLKVWVPMEHIKGHTAENIMREFPPHCWIKLGL